MKTLLFSCALILTCLFSQAQFTKGTIVLGGDLGVSTSSDKTTASGFTSPKTTSTELNVNPSIGWAVHNDLLFGVNLGVGYSNANDDKENDYDFGVFIRKYKTLANRLWFFSEAGLLFACSDDISDNPSSNPGLHVETKSSYVIAGWSPGLAYALNPRWQVEMTFPSVLSAQYNHTKANTTYYSGYPVTQTEYSSDVKNGFAFSTSLANSFQLEVGLKYLIGK